MVRETIEFANQLVCKLLSSQTIELVKHVTLRNYGLQKTLREVAASSHKKRYRHFLH
ncbi:hypothetical protein VCR3J2_80239 [Vibrio coralliirubri]|nr:hypothetical protein VCR3J2_80239 [Vibrio coralliirubri]